MANKVPKILVLDDSKLIQKMYQVMLRNYALVPALDGREGMDLLAANPDVSLVLLDINMPAIDGIAFLKYLKADPELAKIPVIIVSTEGKDEDIQRGMDGGAAAYIKKPFDGEALVGAIGRVLATGTTVPGQ